MAAEFVVSSARVPHISRTESASHRAPERKSRADSFGALVVEKRHRVSCLEDLPQGPRALWKALVVSPRQSLEVL